MASDIPWAHPTDGGWRLDVHVQPGARQSEVAGLHGDRLKIRIAGPPVEGKANAELVRYLADRFRVPRRAVRIVRGARGRAKTVEVTGDVDPAHIAGS